MKIHNSGYVSRSKGAPVYSTAQISPLDGLDHTRPEFCVSFFDASILFPLQERHKFPVLSIHWCAIKPSPRPQRFPSHPHSPHTPAPRTSLSSPAQPPEPPQCACTIRTPHLHTRNKTHPVLDSSPRTRSKSTPPRSSPQASSERPSNLEYPRSFSPCHR